MTTWTDKSYADTLGDSNELLRAAQALNEALGAGGGATSPDDVLRALRQAHELINKMENRLALYEVSGNAQAGRTPLNGL